jgi:hypothetical protein
MFARTDQSDQGDGTHIRDVDGGDGGNEANG